MTGPPKDVILVWLDPAAVDIQISGQPERSETKAIFFPSGEYLALESGHVELINNSAPPGVWPTGVTFARQMSVSLLSVE